MITPLLKQLVTKRDHPLENAEELFTYSIETSHIATVLDTYDFDKWLDLCIYFGEKDPYGIYAGLNAIFEGEELGDAIDELCVDEFMEYLSSRYNVRFDEEIRYRMRRVTRREEING